MKAVSKTCLFLIFTFVISYTLAAAYYMVRGGNAITDQIGFPIMGALYMFIPFICVIIVKKIHKERLFSDLLISFKINKWFFVAWLAFPIFAFCTLGINILFPGISYDSEMTGFLSRFEGIMSPEAIEETKNQIALLSSNIFILILLIQGLIAGATINALAGFGEEVGWRGFLLKEFKEMHFFKAALTIGFIWGIWHAPIILMGHNYPKHPQIGVLMMIIYCILLTPIFQYITIKSKSVIAAAIAHGTHNAIVGIAIMVIAGGNDLTTGTTGFPGFIALLIFNIVFFVYDYFISKEKIMINKISSYI